MSSTLYPEVRDVGSLSGVFNLDQFLVIGVEGQKDTVGTAVVGTPYVIADPGDANIRFGPASKLATLVNFLLARGLSYVVAVASASNVAPTLVQRQAAWTTLEDNPDIRIRLTDSETQADLVALADSAEFAEGIQNKQFAIMGLATPTTQAALTTAAGAIASKRGMLVGPGVYDSNGVLLSGRFVAAFVATEIARNADIADDLDTLPLVGTTGIEKDASGMPLFRVKANAGTPVNDFDVLMNAGVTPMRQGRTGLAEIVHLRMSWTTDSTYDALMTLLIKDQLFIDIRTLLTNPVSGNFLRRGNTADNRSLAAAMVDAALQARRNWLQPKALPNGTLGYGVTVTPSSDLKRMIVTYQGEVIRGIQKIDINGVLTIPA